MALDAGKSQRESPWRGPPDLFEEHQEVSMIRARGARGRAARKSQTSAGPWLVQEMDFVNKTRCRVGTRSCVRSCLVLEISAWLFVEGRREGTRGGGGRGTG